MSFTLIGKHEGDARAMREGYVNALRDMLLEGRNIVHIDCDLESSSDVVKIAKTFPKNIFNAGIAEANAMGVGAGLAAVGKTVFIHSFATFASRRSFDQSFLSGAYAGLPIHVIGSDPGICASYNGGTHMPFEDMGIFLCVPDAIVVEPSDYAMLNWVTRELADSGKFSYLRMRRKGFTTIYEDGSTFELGKGAVLREGKDVAIIASGIMVDEALKAEEMLRAEGISARIIDMFTWKPLDEDLVNACAEECGCIVTAENHQVTTGLGVTVASCLVRHKPVPMEMVGVLDRFGQVGTEDSLRKEYNLTAADIVAAAKKAIARK